MKTVKVSEATNLQLDYLVATIRGGRITILACPAQIMIEHLTGRTMFWFNPTGNWSQGGPLIEQAKIELTDNGSNPEEEWYWAAHIVKTKSLAGGKTALTAAMRAFVISKIGETAELPEAL